MGGERSAPASFVTTLLVLLGLAVAGKPLRADDDTIKIGFIDPFPVHSLLEAMLTSSRLSSFLIT